MFERKIDCLSIAYTDQIIEVRIAVSLFYELWMNGIRRLWLTINCFISICIICVILSDQFFCQEGRYYCRPVLSNKYLPFDNTDKNYSWSLFSAVFTNKTVAKLITEFNCLHSKHHTTSPIKFTRTIKISYQPTLSIISTDATKQSYLYVVESDLCWLNQQQRCHTHDGDYVVVLVVVHLSFSSLTVPKFFQNQSTHPREIQAYVSAVLDHVEELINSRWCDSRSVMECSQFVTPSPVLVVDVARLETLCLTRLWSVKWID